MKKQILSVAAVLAFGLLATNQCSAQQRVLAVDVPFSFDAGGKVLPAGEYRVYRISTGTDAAQMIREADAKLSTIVLTDTVERTGNAPSPRLVFHVYGNEYFLAEIWNGESEGRELPKTAREKELATASTKMVEFAVLADVPSVRP